VTSIVTVTGPSSELVTLDEARKHLRVDSTDEDDMILSWIIAARQYCEAVTKRSFGVQSYRWKIDSFPSDRYLLFPMSPLVSVTSISYQDTNGDLQTFSDYIVNVDSVPGQIYLDYDAYWPSIYDMPSAVTILFTAGYAPAMVKTAIKMLVADFYQNRETKILGVSVVENATVDRLLAPLTLYYLS